MGSWIRIRISIRVKRVRTDLTGTRKTSTSNNSKTLHICEDTYEIAKTKILCCHDL